MENEDQQGQNEFERWKTQAREEYQGLSLEALVQKFKLGYDAKEKAERRLAEVNARFDVLRYEAIPMEMDKMGIENIRYEGIGRVSLTADLQINTKDKPGLFAWLKKRKLGDLIQPSINASTLKSFYKKRLKDGKDLPTEYLTVNPVTRASITKG